jgi:hypothetical protein
MLKRKYETKERNDCEVTVEPLAPKRDALSFLGVVQESGGEKRRSSWIASFSGTLTGLLGPLREGLAGLTMQLTIEKLQSEGFWTVADKERMYGSDDVDWIKKRIESTAGRETA